MGRHSASYIAAQQDVSATSNTVAAAKYVGRVGGLALALGIGAAVAGGAGLAHAEGTPDGSAKTSDKEAGDVDSATKTKPTTKLGSFNLQKALGGGPVGQAPDPSDVPGLIAKIPQRLAGLVADHTSRVVGTTTAPSGGNDAQGSTRPRARHTAIFGQSSPTSGDAKTVDQVRKTVDDVVTAVRNSAPSLDPAPPAPNVNPPARLDATSSPAANVVTPGPTRTVAPIATTISGLVSSFGGAPSGGGGTPAVPTPILTGALQLLRRDTSAPSAASATQTPIFAAIAALFTPTPAPVLPTHPTTPSTTDVAPLPGDVAPTQYGNIGKWMLQSNGQVSTYGGQPYQGKTLVEPVNVIIVDPSSKSELESTLKVNSAMAWGGFPAQPIHSSGFMGKIGNIVYGQQPGGLINAYSDNLFIFQNNHGRLFGAAPAPGGGYVYSGAFSTETPTIYNGLPGHAYVASNAARDALALKLLASGQVKSIDYVALNNAYNTATTTTGDHDGYAVVITLK